MSPFAFGDAVRVRGTRQPMVVLRCDDDGTRCAWLERDPAGRTDVVRDAVFQTGELELVPSSELP